MKTNANADDIFTQRRNKVTFDSRRKLLNKNDKKVQWYGQEKQVNKYAT